MRAVLRLAVLLAILPGAAVPAWAGEVPAEYQDLYSFLDRKLDAFDASIRRSTG